MEFVYTLKFLCWTVYCYLINEHKIVVMYIIFMIMCLIIIVDTMHLWLKPNPQTDK
jgi:hypothetical protein